MSGNRVLTNNTSFRFGIEPSLGTAPSTGNWHLLEPNEIGVFGATIETVVRRPISTGRGRRAGTVVNLTSAVEYTEDLTLSSMNNFLEGFMFAEYANISFDVSGFKMNRAALPVTATGYDLTVGANFTAISGGYGTNLTGKTFFDSTGPGAATLFYAKGYSTAANNGLKAINALLTGASTEVTISGLVAEAVPPTNASLVMAGLRFTNTGANAIALSAANTPATGQRTLTVDAAVSSFSWITAGLRAGMWIHIGSGDSSGTLQNAFSTSTVYGYARVRVVTATVLTLDKLDVKITGGAVTPVAGEVIDILYGRFARNLDVAATGIDTLYLERSYQFEGRYPGLSGNTAEYEYPVGNLANVLTLNLPVADKAEIEWAFVGTTSEPITSTRKSGPPDPANALSPLNTTAFNTSSDIIALTTDLVTLAEDVCFKDLSVSINNNESPEQCLGHLGSVHINTGQFLFDIEGQMFFSDKNIVNAIRDNDTVTFAMVLKNEDGAIVVDMPSGKAGNGGREFPLDATVLANITLASFTDSFFGFDVGVNLLVGTPTTRP